MCVCILLIQGQPQPQKEVQEPRDRESTLVDGPFGYQLGDTDRCFPIVVHMRLYETRCVCKSELERRRKKKCVRVCN